MATLPRRDYAAMYGPTVGDRVRLADTDLWISPERDFAIPGEEVKFGGGKVIRDGMGQSQRARSEGAVDTVITNALILDWSGVIKADVGLRDGDVAAGLRAVHTPGHAPDHLCFAARDGTLFRGDHVMGWSTSTVNPPAGRMADYVAGLRRLLQRDDTLYLPGHGPPLPDPQAFVQGLIAHRRARENAVMTRLAEGGQTAAALTQALYAGVDPRLLRAAERNVLAHLVKLEEEGRAVRDGAGWRAAG